MNTTNKQVAVYLIASFCAAWALQIVAIFCQNNAAVFQVCLALSMFAPMLGVATACKGLSQRKSGIGWRLLLKGHVKLLFAALLIPGLFTFVGALVVFTLFPNQFDPGMQGIVSQLKTMGIPVADGSINGMPLSAILAIQVVSAVLINPFLGVFLAVGEETGWRGFLTPALQQRLGYRIGIVVSGVIWGAWHWPVIIFAGYEYGHGYWGEPLSGMLLFCLFTASAGVLLSLLYEKSGSIWYPSLAHAAINAASGLPLFLMSETVTSYLHSPLPVGVVPVSMYVVVSGVLLVRAGRIKGA